MPKFSLSLVALAVSTSSMAVETQTDDIERIIVSGSRVIESIDEVPASITVISQRQIEEHLKVNPELQSLLAQMVPGLAPIQAAQAIPVSRCGAGRLWS